MVNAAPARLTDPTTQVTAGRRAVYGLLLAAFCVTATVSVPVEDPVRSPDALGVALLVAPAVTVGWAPPAPRLVLTLTSLCAVAFYALGYSSIFAPAPATVAVFAAVLVGRRPYALGAAALLCLGAFSAGVLHGLPPSAAAAGPGWIAAWTLAAGAAGEALRQRRRLLEAERRRAADAASRGAEQERLRIARELHDSLTHSISVINVQASVAAHLIDSEPGRIPYALDTIRSASADALRELRSTVEVLRRIDTDSDADPADEPGPSLTRLPQLAERSREAGQDVETVGDTDMGGLPPEVDRAAYRVIQESLSNAARHAPGGRVRITLVRGPRDLEVTVDNGTPSCASHSAPEGPGTGLVGMRERLALLGGRLRAGPCEGGFRVHAVIPLPDPRLTDGPRPEHTPEEPPA